MILFHPDTIQSLCVAHLLKIDIKQFKTDIQEAFQKGFEDVYGKTDGIILPEKETLYTSVLSGNVLSDKKELVIENSDEIQLKYEYFKVDALVFAERTAKTAIPAKLRSTRMPITRPISSQITPKTRSVVAA